MKRLALYFVLGSLLASSGCVSTTIQEVRQGETGILAGESVAILGRKHRNREEASHHFIDCVATKTAAGSDKLAIMSDSAFIDALFPWFEPRSAPIELSEMGRLIAVPEVAQRIKEIGVRYIVWVDGTTERRDQSGALQCAVASGGVPACFGFLSWEGEAEYEATVWDITNEVSVGKLSSEASGVSFVPAVVVPLPFIARVQASACSTLSDQLKTFITG